MAGKVVTKTGATVQAWGMMYKAVMQLVLLYESESWVVTGAMIKLLEAFNNGVSRSITRSMAHLMTSGEWEFPLVAEALKIAVLFPIKGYIHWRQANLPAQVLTTTT